MVCSFRLACSLTVLLFMREVGGARGSKRWRMNTEIRSSWFLTWPPSINLLHFCTAVWEEQGAVRKCDRREGKYRQVSHEFIVNQWTNITWRQDAFSCITNILLPTVNCPRCCPRFFVCCTFSPFINTTVNNTVASHILRNRKDAKDEDFP